MGKWSSSTHWVNGSQTTGQASSTPNCCTRAVTSSGFVTGVMRSTIALGKATCSASQGASGSPSGERSSCRAAKAPTMSRATSPLPGRLSQDITVNGSVPAARRRRSASVTKPKALRGVPGESRSACRAGSSGSNRPVTWLTW